MPAGLRFPHLRTLVLSHNKMEFITGCGIETLLQLRVLDISHNRLRLSGEHLAELASVIEPLQHLVAVGIAGNKVPLLTREADVWQTVAAALRNLDTPDTALRFIDQHYLTCDDVVSTRERLRNDATAREAFRARVALRRRWPRDGVEPGLLALIPTPERTALASGSGQDPAAPGQGGIASFPQLFVAREEHAGVTELVDALLRQPELVPATSVYVWVGAGGVVAMHVVVGWGVPVHAWLTRRWGCWGLVWNGMAWNGMEWAANP